MRQVVFGVLGLIGLVIAFEVGRYFKFTPLVVNDYNILVSSDGKGNCAANLPIIGMHYSADRVQWVSQDDHYSITFSKPGIVPPEGYPVLPNDYQPESPLEHDEDNVPFYPGHPTGLFKVHQKTKYYYYAIFDQSNPSKACKVSTDDHDPGLNVKR